MRRRAARSKRRARGRSSRTRTVPSRCGITRCRYPSSRARRSSLAGPGARLEWRAPRRALLRGARLLSKRRRQVAIEVGVGIAGAAEPLERLPRDVVRIAIVGGRVLQDRGRIAQKLRAPLLEGGEIDQLV